MCVQRVACRDLMVNAWCVECVCRESHRLIHHAAAKGVKEAHDVLNTLCTKGHCV